MMSSCSWDRPMSPNAEVEHVVSPEERTPMEDPAGAPSPLFAVDVERAHKHSETIRGCLRCHGGGPGGPPPISFEGRGPITESSGPE